MRPIIRILVTCLLLIGLLPTAPAQSLVISTNNTPLDRKALELLSQEAFRTCRPWCNRGEQPV